MRNNNPMAVSTLKRMVLGDITAEQLADKIISFDGSKENDIKVSYQEDYADISKHIKQGLLESMGVDDVMIDALHGLLKEYPAIDNHENPTHQARMTEKALDYQHRHIFYRTLGFLAAKLVSVGDYEVSLYECYQEAIDEYVDLLLFYRNSELHKAMMGELAVASYAA